MPKFDDMNETDVREMIVRPLLNRLGYEHGTENTIRTEQTFRYAKAFLGRKNAAKDPPLVGRADYILEVASIGRWVVEVKGPGEELDRDVVEQAHTYAAHPEVAALFFMVTNGLVCLGKPGPFLKRAREGIWNGERHGTSAVYAGADHREAA